jgi:hypothetical protein
LTNQNLKSSQRCFPATKRRHSRVRAPAQPVRSKRIWQSAASRPRRLRFWIGGVRSLSYLLRDCSALSGGRPRLLRVTSDRAVFLENRSMSGMPRKRQLAIETRSVAKGQAQTMVGTEHFG